MELTGNYDFMPPWKTGMESQVTRLMGQETTGKLLTLSRGILWPFFLQAIEGQLPVETRIARRPRRVLVVNQVEKLGS